MWKKIGEKLLVKERMALKNRENSEMKRRR